MKFAPYSFSRIDSHRHCPRKFKYKYVDKVPEGYTDRTALLKGGAVHSVFEHYPDESPHKLAPDYKHIVENFLKTNLGKEIFFGKSVREYDFGITEDFEICDYNDSKAMFRGSIDFIRTDDQGLILVDWKTGRAKEITYQDFSQLMWYAIFFFTKYSKINNITIRYVYVEHENHDNTLVLSREHLENYKKTLIDSIDTIETDSEFNKNQSKLCDWCAYKDHCNNDNI